MRILILFLVFLLSPAAARLLRASTNEAQRVAQAIVDTLHKAYDTTDTKLLLSLFDKSFEAYSCFGHRINYETLEATGRKGDLIENRVQLEIRTAEFSHNELRFLVDKQDGTKIRIHAKNFGGIYRIVSYDTINKNCPHTHRIEPNYLY